MQQKKKTTNVESSLIVENFSDADIHIRELTATLKNNINSEVRLSAVSQLGEYGKKATTVLIDALNEEKNEVVLSEIIKTLGNIGDEVGVGYFIEKLEGSAVIRASVISAFGMIGSSKYLPYLRKALEDKDRRVRIEAIHAIARICSLELYDDLLNISRNDTDAEVRAESVEALVKIALYNQNQKIFVELRKELILQEEKSSKVPFLQMVILEGLKELQIFSDYEDVISDRDNIYLEKQELEKQLKTISDKKNKTREIPSYRRTNIFYISGLILLITVIIEGIFLVKEANIKQKEIQLSDEKIKVLEAKITLQNDQEQQAKETTAKYQQIKDMEEEINKFAINAISDNTKVAKVFMKCHDAFFNTKIKDIGLDLAYRKKKYFFDSAQLASSGKIKEAQELYKQAEELK
ncbi:MAG: HEAT repeat domain-containing protein [Elusimicrobia bacterium]|nr:HEAT repeat domain-containing protein [Elusimicrobiota bacterium]